MANSQHICLVLQQAACNRQLLKTYTSLPKPSHVPLAALGFISKVQYGEKAERGKLERGKGAYGVHFVVFTIYREFDVGRP